MKKLIHREKLKLMEKAKTLILVLLFLLCVFLGYRILRLYRMQTNVEGALWGNTGSTAEMTENGADANLYTAYDRPYPSVITANSSASRTLIEANSRIYDEIAGLADSLVQEMYAVKSEYISLSNISEWQDALNSASLYIKYPVERFLGTESLLYGIKPGSAAERIKSFSEMIVAYDKVNEDAVSVIIPEMNSERLLRVALLGDTAKAFKEKAKKLDADDGKQYVFAWELNLDNETEENQTTLNSMILIPAEEEKVADVRVAVPKLYKSGLNFTKATDLTLGIISAFNYNPNTIRQYTGKNNAFMYVGETGSLNLHPNGLIEYKALDKDDGIPLSTKEDFGEMMHNLCILYEKLMRISGVNAADTEFKILLTGMPSNFRFGEKAELYFDYFAEGNLVKLDDLHGIVAVVQSGNLVELKMNLKNIEVLGKQSEMPSLTDEIRRFCAENPEYRKINNAYGIYKYKADGEDISAEWSVEGVR